MLVICERSAVRPLPQKRAGGLCLCQQIQCEEWTESLCGSTDTGGFCFLTLSSSSFEINIAVILQLSHPDHSFIQKMSQWNYDMSAMVGPEALYSFDGRSWDTWLLSGKHMGQCREMHLGTQYGEGGLETPGGGCFGVITLKFKKGWIKHLLVCPKS